MAVGAAIGAAVIGAGASVASSKKAASAQKKAAKIAAQQSGLQFSSTQQSLEGFRQGGTQAFQEQAALGGGLGPEAEAQAFQRFQESPEFQFGTRGQEQALLRNEAAIGGLGGGNVRTALQEQAVALQQQQLQNRFNRLGALAGVGLQAATKVAAAGQGQSQLQANLLQNQGNAQAAGILGQNQAFQSGLSGIAGIVGSRTGGTQPTQSSNVGFTPTTTGTNISGSQSAAFI